MRPTADKVRAAIFNILEARYGIREYRVLDLFAGSGALGLDALSRGAAHVTFVDQGRESCVAIRENLERAGFQARAVVRRLSLPAGLERLAGEKSFGGVFLDPPYRKGLSAAVLRRIGDGSVPLLPDAWVVVEHASEEDLPEEAGRLLRRDQRRYGSTAISLYVAQEGE